MAVEGSLDLFSLPEILQMISQQGKTGILTIQGQQDIVAISFLAGRIVAADSLAHTVEEGLAKLLVSEGMLSAAQLSRAGVEHQATGGRLLDLLVERRYLTRPQLLGALRLQTVRQLEALLRWQEGDFKFYGGDEVSYEEGFEPISVEDLLLRNLGDFRDPVPAAQAPAVRGKAVPPPAAAAVPAGGAAGARVVPGPGAATRARRPAVEAKADSGELWLPQVPDLPEVAMPPGAVRQGPAAAPATGAGVPAGPATAGAAAAGLAAAGLAAVGLPAAGPGALGPPAAGPPPAAGLPGGAAIPAILAAPAASAAVLPAAQPSSSELLPWPAAALQAPPTAPPARPRPTGAGVAKPQGLAAAGGPAAGAAGLTGPSASPVLPPPAAAAATGRVTRVTPQAQGGLASFPEAPGQARIDPSSSAPGRRPPAVGGRILPEGTPGKILPRWFRQMQVERPERLVPLAHRLAAAGLAVAAAAALVAAMRSAPESVLLPFPWEQGERTAFVRNQRESLYDKIEAAAKTSFLRDYRFPDRLSQLRDSGLLSSADLIDPGGEPLLYSAREDSYTLQATESGKPLAGADTSASISGNFFLDPSLLQNSSQTGPPIVLLD